MHGSVRAGILPPVHDPAHRWLTPRRAYLVLAGLLVLFTSLRVWRLDLDAPSTVERGYSGQAQYRDEPAKAHEARNKAKWGAWSLSEADDYGFWRAQSPAWVWGEYAWFRAFGVGLIQARAYVVVQTVLALALLMWLAMIRHGLPAAVATGLLLGLNWSYLVYSRLALMEGALICWLLVATVMLSQIERNPARTGLWSLLATLAMLIASTIKQTGLLLVPAFAIAMILLGLRAAGDAARLDDADARWPERLRARLRRREAQITLVCVATLAGALGLVVFSPEYQQRLEFNAAHFTVAREQSVWAQAAQTLARGLFSVRLQLMFTRLGPLILWLATFEVARQLQIWARQRRARRRGDPAPEAKGSLAQAMDSIDLWMLAWLVLGLLANLASPHRVIRFQLIMLPPGAWLAGALLGRIWDHAWPSRAWTRAVRAGVVALGLLGSSVTLARMVAWVETGEATAAEIGSELEALIGPREAVVVGEFAAQAVFETDYKHFYVRPNQFNYKREILLVLGITHVIVEDPETDRTLALLEREVPELLVGKRMLGTVRFRGADLQVWELPAQTNEAPIRGAR
jgi:hypothetical protein